jgi:oligopeptide/dipeptide ABC transporter ATP-binding protein
MRVMEDRLLSIRGLRTYFQTPEGLKKAVNGVDLDIDKGEIVGIAGESGCGKSTMALSIMRLTGTAGRIVDGKIWFENKDLLTMTEEEMGQIRGKKISMVFQEPMTSLSPVHKIADQMIDVITGHERVGRKVAAEKAIKILESVKIPAPGKIMQTYPHQLSGGMRQRAMIAMALSCNPSLLIADEPTSALDVITQLQITKLIKELQREFEMALMLISHSLYLLAEVCERISIMYMGDIIESTDTGTLFNEPKHPYTLGLLDSIPRFDRKAEEFRTIKGDVPNSYKIPEGCPFNPRCNHAMQICRERKPRLEEIFKGQYVSCHLYDKR